VDPDPRRAPLGARPPRAEGLRSADALQLGAALVSADSNPDGLPFVTFDERLAIAAEKEGFSVLGA
jgi:hypothetical protein